MSKAVIPRHIKAKTPEELELKMLQATARAGFEQLTFSHVQFVKGFWYAWFLSDAKDLVKLSPVEVSNDGS